MHRKTMLLAAAAAVTGFIGAGQGALAQTATPPADQGGFVIEEVVVTARRVTENLQDTPVSVSAFTGDMLERRQINSTADLDDATPSLQFAPVSPLTGNSAAAQIFIRGVGQTDATAGVDPGVGLYIDDVYMGSAVGGVMDFRDIAGVQVLRGPQGTLFGRNTIGGAILLTTAAPGEEFGGSFKAGFGTDNLREGILALNVPVSDTLKTRFTYGTRVQDGYVTRLYDGKKLGDVNTFTITGKARWTPTEKFTAELRGDYTKSDENGAPLVFAAINETSAFPRAVSYAAGCPGMASVGTAVPMVKDARCANDFYNAGKYANNGTHPVNSDLEGVGGSLLLEYRLADALTLKSISAYRSLEWAGSRDADNTPFPILATDYASKGFQVSQEFQALYSGSRLTGVAGLFLFRQAVDDILTVTLSPPTAPTGTRDSNNNEVRNKNWAAFSQWTFKATEALSVTAGLRYTDETKGSRPYQFNYSNPTVLYVPYKLYERKFSATTGSFQAQYRWNPAVMTYVSWSQGFKGGGFNSRFNGVVAAGQPPSFEPETAETTEVGAKLDLGGKLRINADVFSTAYEDLQFTYRVGTAPYLFNAGKATIKGLEVEYTYVPTNKLVVEGGFSYLDDSIDEVSTIVGATTSVTTNSQLPYTPKWQGNVSVAYTVDLPNDLTLIPRGEIVYIDSQFFDAGNTKEIAQLDAITKVNLGVLLENRVADWKAQLSINNLTKEIYPVAGNSSLGTSSGYAEVAYNRGREVALSFTKRF
ncbi:TonB-dependent receptor [Caulobacter hibisci]|uniref:TonB-dependent receptor n=1 Tax=Caulobacter hibisci TaxID=2035993 RepID=A0ABS0SXM8_9CAUL|nr:TonB-dependent receptor [Caulobacter hibisci]MBI1684294.1 TonB-dependent receptor [Caulobacter hibisci]